MNCKNNEKLYLNNIFIIDWDDTLFPTSWVTKRPWTTVRPCTPSSDMGLLHQKHPQSHA